MLSSFVYGSRRGVRVLSSIFRNRLPCSSALTQVFNRLLIGHSELGKIAIRTDDVIAAPE